MKCTRLLILFLFLCAVTGAQTSITGPSSSRAPYVTPLDFGSSITSILTCGDSIGRYIFCGPPDGLGLLDNNDGSFSVFVNHEFSSANGAVRKHGSRGAFISKWQISKSNFQVLKGEDLISTLHYFNGVSYSISDSSNPATAGAFNRFCSSDLPSASALYDNTTQKGITERLLFCGEEFADGRAFAHVLTGSLTGHSFELPALGRMSFENILLLPTEQIQTIAVCMNDQSAGYLYVYVGTKKDTGSIINRAGLDNGQLYGLRLKGLTAENDQVTANYESDFSLVAMGNVTNLSSAALKQRSLDSNLTTFLRPEDGAWNPQHPENFFFATTNNFYGVSRLWELSFTSILNPLSGGKAKVHVAGNPQPYMMDNICISESEDVMVQEDPGSQSYLSGIWRYSLSTNSLHQVAKHSRAFFQLGAPQFLTIDEESSGIADASNILGKGWYLYCSQAHYFVNNKVNEGGQLMAFYDAGKSTGITEIKSEQNSVAFPTLCEGTLFLHTLDSDYTSISFFSLDGNELRRVPIDDTTRSVDLAGLPNTLLLVKIKGSHKSETLYIINGN